MNELCSSRKAQQSPTNAIIGVGMIAITLMVAAVIIGLGNTILEKISVTQTDNSATIANNESFAYPGNNTLTTFTNSRVQTGSVRVYCNATILTAGVTQNYTTETFGVRIINQTAATSGMGLDLQLCTYNMTYAFNYGSSARNTTQFGVVGLSTMGSFLPTVAIVAMAGIVIGIILVFFGRRKDREG